MATPRWLSEAEATLCVPADVTVVRQGSVPKHVLLIDDGIVLLQHRSARRRPALIGYRFPGWFVGAHASILGEPQSLSCVTVTACRFYRWPQHAFVQLLRTDGDLSRRIADMHARELVDRQQAQAGVETWPPITRLRHLLLRLLAMNEASETRKAVSLRWPFRRQHLARMLDVTPAQLARLLATLEDEGSLCIGDDATATITNLRSLDVSATPDVGWPLNAQHAAPTPRSPVTRRRVLMNINDRPDASQ